MLVVSDGKFVGGSKKMRCEDVRITRIENRLFEWLSGERLGVLNEVRIEWVFAGNERRERRGCAPTRSPELLPQRRARPGPCSAAAR